jgi:SAM-dependent methyltransferase
MNIFDRVNNTANIPDVVKYYWGYQYKLAAEVLIPHLSKNHAFKENDKVMEIGCAEGGVLAAFVEKGASNATGTDIVSSRLESGRSITNIAGLKIDFVMHNIIEDPINEKWLEKFDLILLRDVIEHLEQPEKALRNIYKILKPGAFLFVTFPPYNSPYGGHQHTVNNKTGKLPFIHHLPNSIFHKLISSGRENDIGEVKRLQKIRLSPDQFVYAAKREMFDIVKEEHYLLRPVFKMKFGLPTIPLGNLAKNKFIKNYVSMEASYLLKK